MYGLRGCSGVVAQAVIVGLSRRGSVCSGGGIPPCCVKGRLPLRWDDVPLEFVRAIDGADCCESVRRGTEGISIRSYKSLERDRDGAVGRVLPSDAGPSSGLPCSTCSVGHCFGATDVCVSVIGDVGDVDRTMEGPSTG